MYVCGITPYDTTHLGHAFTYVWFDALFRYLKFKDYQVDYTQNVTDIDDDILKKAKEEKKDWKEIGDFWTVRFLTDMKSLNVLRPANFVKATSSITLMIYIIRVLLKKEFAYYREGNVYFDISKSKGYGKLSRFNDNQMKLLLKERGGNPDDPLKKNPLDFLVWQKSKKDEPFWKCPWGNGRPGWHIECSAMIKRFLGNQIDIHGGGRDLIFPHHESEIVQSESFTDKKPFVKYWMHTGMVLCQGEKMAKSLGNLVMVSDLLKHYSHNEIRWMLLSHHYRSPWEFEENDLKDARKQVKMMEEALLRKGEDKERKGHDLKRFIKIMDDDINTPKALEFLKSVIKIKGFSAYVFKCLQILGFSF